MTPEVKYILINSIEYYKKSPDKFFDLEQIKHKLDMHESGKALIGFGYAESTVTAARIFLRYVSLYKL